MENKINTSKENAKWYTVWKKRMESGKPREGDYNFVLWKNGDEIIVEPFSQELPPSIFQDGKWISLKDLYDIKNSVDLETEV
jgi:hypothetical protein